MEWIIAAGIFVIGTPLLTITLIWLMRGFRFDSPRDRLQSFDKQRADFWEWVAVSMAQEMTLEEARDWLVEAERRRQEIMKI